MQFSASSSFCGDMEHRAKNCRPNFLVGFRRARLVVVRDWNSSSNLYLNYRTMSFSTRALLIRARDGLRRMPFHSLWNNPRRVHDHRALPRISEGVFCGNAHVSLKLLPAAGDETCLIGDASTHTAAILKRRNAIPVRAFWPRELIAPLS